MAEPNSFSVACTCAGKILTQLGEDAERNPPGTTYFERDVYQPVLDAVADVLKELANVKLVH